MSDDKDNVLTGKWTQTNSNALPNTNITMLMHSHEERAIADVTLALRESVNDFMSQYRLIEHSSLDVMEKVENIEAHPDDRGFDFPFARILADMRETEAKTGIYGHFDINDLFPSSAETDVFAADFQSHEAAEFIKCRQQAAWRAASELKRHRACYGDEGSEPAATRVSKSTNIALNILVNNWMKKRPAGEYSYTPFMHNIGQLAHNFIDPQSKDFAQDLISREAQRFVKELPYLKNRNLFTKMINANMRQDHERKTAAHTGEHQTVVPLPFKTGYPEL